MEFNISKTQRGFGICKFADGYGEKCSIQESSIAADEAYIWIGIDDANPQILASQTIQGGNGWIPYHIPDNVLLNTRMHLSQSQVKALLPLLKRFVKTGQVEVE